MQQDNVSYVYVITRSDLSLPTQAVQSGHALYEASQQHYNKDDEHPHFVFTSVKNEGELYRWIGKLERLGVRFYAWSEPDMDNELTAIATEPVYGSGRRFFKNLKLVKEKK